MLKKLTVLFISLILILSFAGCANNTSNSVATVNDEKIAKEYFEFYFTQLKNTMQIQPGDTTWENATLEGKTALEYVRERALQSVVEDKLIEMKAKEDGVKLTSEDKKNMNTIKQQWVSQFGSNDKFVKAIKDNYGIDEEQFDYMLEVVYYRNHIIDKYVDDNSVDVPNYYKNNIAKVKHILIATVDLSTAMPLPADELEAAKNTIAEIQEKINSGVDFDSLVAEYTQDQDTFYYVGEGFSLASDGSQGSSMVAEFQEASLGLGNGQISDVVESAYGYHIIKRYESDDAMYNISKDTLTSVLKNQQFVNIMDEWRKNAKIEVNEEVYNSYR